MSQASSFLRFLLGAAKSNSIQVQGIFAVMWGAILKAEVIQTNPEYAAILGGLQAIIAVLMRAKTDKPLSER